MVSISTGMLFGESQIVYELYLCITPRLPELRLAIYGNMRIPRTGLTI